MIEKYQPLELTAYFESRLRDFYAIPLGIYIQFWDSSFGIPGKPAEFHVVIQNQDHEHDWEPPWGSIKGPDFARVLMKICKEIEEKFGVVFPTDE